MAHACASFDPFDISLWQKASALEDRLDLVDARHERSMAMFLQGPGQVPHRRNQNYFGFLSLSNPSHF